jgi:hypothetical protein
MAGSVGIQVIWATENGVSGNVKQFTVGAYLYGPAAERT